MINPLMILYNFHQTDDVFHEKLSVFIFLFLVYSPTSLLIPCLTIERDGFITIYLYFIAGSVIRDWRKLRGKLCFQEFDQASNQSEANFFP